MALHTLAVARTLEEPFFWEARLNALLPNLECLAREAKFVSWTPTTLRGTLLVAHKSLKEALLWGFVVLQKGVVLLRLHDPLPVDLLRVAEVVVLQDGHAARPDPVEGAKVERFKRCLHNVEGREVFCEVSSPNDLKIGKCREVSELRVMCLDIDVPCHLLQSLEHLQLVWVHFGIARAKSEVLVDLLEPVESAVQNCETSFKHRAVAKALDVPGMDGVRKVADLGAGAVAGNALTILGLQQDKIKIN